MLAINLAWLKSKVRVRSLPQVYFEVDATKLGSGEGPLGAGCTLRFDVITFYFPHSGVHSGSTGLQSNQQLLAGFLLKAAPRLLKPGGEVQVGALCMETVFPDPIILVDKD